MRSKEEQNQDQSEQAAFDIESVMSKPKKALDQYERIFNSNTEFFSTYNPDMIEEMLVGYLEKKQFEVKAKEDKYKIKYTLRGKDELDDKMQDDVDVCVRILQVDNSKVCVEFTKLSGKQTTFLKHFEQCKSDQNILSDFNDCNYETAASE